MNPQETQKTVLVVDDDPSVLAVVERILSREHYLVKTLSNGTQVLKTAKELRPDLIILDVVMPDLDGVDIAGYLQEDYATVQIPILYLTALDGSGAAPTAGTIMTIHVLNKPVNAEELVTRVRELTNAKK
jgi:two-component system sensor histidine kinase/response regulator